MVTTTHRNEISHAKIGVPELLHLFLGDCLLGGGCQICDQMDRGSVNGPRIIRLGFVHDLWEVRKEELTAAWTARLESRDEHGRYFPWYVECLVDNAKLPDLNPRWPERVRDRHGFIASNLYVFREWVRANP